MDEEEYAEPERYYYVYDGRAAGGDTSRATVLVACDSLDEARGYLEHYADAVIYSYKPSGGFAIDERREMA